MIWSLFKNLGSDDDPNLSKEYLGHDGTDYRFQETKLQEIRSKNPNLKDYQSEIAELIFFVNTVSILDFVVGRKDENFSNIICEFVFHNEESIFFRNTKILFREDDGNLSFLSKELETLFMPYLLCLHGALDELYTRLVEEQKRLRLKEKEVIIDCFKEELESLTYKGGE